MRALALLALVVGGGCLDALAPTVGPLQVSDAGSGSGCSNADSQPGTTVSFATDMLAGVLQRNRCHTCHTGDGIGVQRTGFDVTSYQTLRAGGGTSGTNIVIPGMPCTSILFEKIGPSPPFGRQMPYDGPPYLSDADLQLVHDWIAEGANDN